MPGKTWTWAFTASFYGHDPDRMMEVCQIMQVKVVGVRVVMVFEGRDAASFVQTLFGGRFFLE